MASSFMGLYVQREALVSAQKALDITGNNITNVTTEGYSRQRLDVCSVNNTGYNLFYNTSVSLAGQGEEPVGVTQFRNSLLDTKVRTYTTDSAELEEKDSVMSDVETALDNIEANDSGFATTLAKLREALEGFSADNADRNELANVAIEAAKSVTTQMNFLSSRLDDISAQVLGDAKNGTTSVNTILESMAGLNNQIISSYISMGYIDQSAGNYVVDNDYGPLELKDKMNSYIDQLSSYGNVTFKEEENGAFTVTFANQLVVHNDEYAQIAMTEESPKPFDLDYVVSGMGTHDPVQDTYSGLMNKKEWNKIASTYGDVQLYVRADPNKVDISGEKTLTGGKLRGYLDVYNGDGVFAEAGGNVYKGIEYYRDMLNALSTTMTDKFNSVFESSFGFTLFSCKNTQTGTEDFHTAAEYFRVSDEWIKDPSLIAKPKNFNGTATQYEELDNTYINKMLGVMSDKFTYGYTDSAGTVHNDPLTLNFQDFVGHISDSLGVQVESGKRLLDTTEIMLTSVVNARDEVMGVSIDEEGINMINYQKWYNAIARMTTTLDQALDKLINGTGVVGL